MTKHFLAIGIFILLTNCQFYKESKVETDRDLAHETNKHSAIRSVENNVILSKKLPEISIRVKEEFQFLGRFDFEIMASTNEYPDSLQGKSIAVGERLVFAVADETSKIEKLFIVQFEGFSATNDFIYNYNFDNADTIGGHKFRHNTWYYDTKESIKGNPNGEWAMTISFLREKDFQMQDHIMMSRFVGLASKDRKNELIIFYHEMLDTTSEFSLKEWQNHPQPPEIALIDSAFVERSKKSFSIIKNK